MKPHTDVTTAVETNKRCNISPIMLCVTDAVLMNENSFLTKKHFAMSNQDSGGKALPESDDGEPITAGISADEAAKKKKKKSKKVADGSEETDGAAEGGEKMDMDTLCKSIAHLSSASAPAPVSETMIQPFHQVQRSKPADIAAEHAFWGTQPMRKPDGATMSTREHATLKFLLPASFAQPCGLLFWL